MAVLGPMPGSFCSMAMLAVLRMPKMRPLCSSWSLVLQWLLTSSGCTRGPGGGGGPIGGGGGCNMEILLLRLNAGAASSVGMEKLCNSS